MGLFDFLAAKPIKTDLVLAEFDKFVEYLEANGCLPDIQTTISLRPNEHAYMEASTELHESRAFTQYASGPRVSFRVMKGVYVGTGSSGRSKSEQELTHIDNGVLTITDQRFVFVGFRENRIIPIDKVISVRPLVDALEVSSETRPKTMYFTVNPQIWLAVYEMITGTGNFGTIVRG